MSGGKASFDGQDGRNYNKQRSFDENDDMYSGDGDGNRRQGQFEDYRPGKSYDQGADGPLTGTKKNKVSNMAMSVMPSGGQFISNPKKMPKGRNLA